MSFRQYTYTTLIRNIRDDNKVSIDDIESLVNEIEPSAPFNRTMVAEQYHQSLSMEDEQSA